jgi:hypothetical protein
MKNAEMRGHMLHSSESNSHRDSPELVVAFEVQIQINNECRFPTKQNFSFWWELKAFRCLSTLVLR